MPAVKKLDLFVRIRNDNGSIVDVSLDNNTPDNKFGLSIVGLDNKTTVDIFETFDEAFDSFAGVIKTLSKEIKYKRKVSK